MRLEMQLKSGMAMAAPIIRAMEVMSPLSLAQGQFEHLTDEHGGLDCVIRVLHRSPPDSGLGWSPIVNRILREPYGDVAAVAQCVVVLGPIRDFVKRLLYLVAPALVEFVGHGLLGRTVWPESCPNLWLLPTKSIYSTTPR